MISPPTPINSVGLFLVPGHSGIHGNEIANELTRDGSVHHFVGSEPALGVSRQIIKKKIQCWLDKQHMTLWQGLASTQRQARELISGPRTAAKTRLLAFNRMQSRVVIGLLTGRNTMRRDLHIMGLRDSPLCSKCRAEEETSAHVLCECETLVTHRFTYLSFLLFVPWGYQGTKSGGNLELY
jgi:hypothetical protein